MSQSSEPTAPITAPAHVWKARVRQIADQLGEPHSGPRRQIARIVQVLGVERTQALADEALALVAAGGEQTRNGQRPRTKGGIFFRLVRQLGSEHEMIRRLFMAHPPKRPAAGAIAAPPAPPMPPATWEDRLTALDELLAEGGGSRTMKVTLTGRPGKIIDKGAYIMTTMPAQKVPALPKGLPTIPDDAQPPQTLVMVAKKQWNKVEPSLSDPADCLILEGFAMYEPAVKGLVVLATNVTTRAMQHAKHSSALPDHL